MAPMDLPGAPHPAIPPSARVTTGTAHLWGNLAFDLQVKVGPYGRLNAPSLLRRLRPLCRPCAESTE